MNTSLTFHLLAVLTLFQAAHAHADAHDLTDWRTDRDAFLSATKSEKKEVLQNLRKPLRPSDFPDLPIDSAFLQQKVAQLSGAVPVQIGDKQVVIAERGGAEGRELARRFLAQEYSSLGFQVGVQTFSSGANFIAEKKGREPSRVLILSSHLDSVGNAGANDDGMGTISALAIARALAGHELRYTLRIVAFDREEVGLVGSNAYVKQLPRGQQEILGDIQLEMMGTNRRKDGAFHVIDCGKPTSVELSQQILNAAMALKLPLKRVPACTTRSDHSAFWDAGLPAVVLSENFFGGDSDPCYHAKCDKLDARLDFAYATLITRAVGSAAAFLLEAR